MDTLLAPHEATTGFDLDTETLQKVYGGTSWNNAYLEIRRLLEVEGFEWRQGSVYFGDPDKVDAVTCVLAVQKLATSLSWFGQAVRDIRMLRIEENNDLLPAVQ
jgi:virulence-associated protein VapD